MIKEERIKKGISARKLAELCNISHTEINNIEKGSRMKPALLTLKGIEKYLGIPFEKSAKMAGYSDETIKYGEKNIIVSYEMYDKLIEEKNKEGKNMLFTIDKKRHLAKDTKKYFNDIHNYLKNQKNIDKKLLEKADSIIKFLNSIEEDYKPINKKTYNYMNSQH